MKVFVNVWPDKSKLKFDTFTETGARELLQTTNVKYDINFHPSDAIDIFLIASADSLLKDLERHNIQAKLGLKSRFSSNYPGFTMFIETEKEKTILPFCARYFRWERVENQDILTIEELCGL